MCQTYQRGAGIQSLPGMAELKEEMPKQILLRPCRMRALPSPNFQTFGQMLAILAY